jgi:hypothetical protein
MRSRAADVTEPTLVASGRFIGAATARTWIAETFTCP